MPSTGAGAAALVVNRKSAPSTSIAAPPTSNLLVLAGITATSPFHDDTARPSTDTARHERPSMKAASCSSAPASWLSAPIRARSAGARRRSSTEVVSAGSGSALGSNVSASTDSLASYSSATASLHTSSPVSATTGMSPSATNPNSGASRYRTGTLGATRSPRPLLPLTCCGSSLVTVAPSQPVMRRQGTYRGRRRGRSRWGGIHSGRRSSDR